MWSMILTVFWILKSKYEEQKDHGFGERIVGFLLFCVCGSEEGKRVMTQDELWLQKYQEVVTFIETNKRNPSRHRDEEWEA